MEGSTLASKSLLGSVRMRMRCSYVNLASVSGSSLAHCSRTGSATARFQPAGAASRTWAAVLVDSAALDRASPAQRRGASSPGACWWASRDRSMRVTSWVWR